MNSIRQAVLHFSFSALSSIGSRHRSLASRLLPFACAFAALLAAKASAQVSITNETYTNVHSVSSSSTITTSGTVEVTSTANVTYSAKTRITLGTGFKISGGLFRLDVGADSDGDGMPNYWEIANGFNPNDPADGAITADADNDDLSNLLEYRLGTNPRGSSSNPTGTTELKVHRAN